MATIASTSANLGKASVYNDGSSISGNWRIPVIEAQKLYYSVTSSGSCSIWLTGWGY